MIDISEEQLPDAIAENSKRIDAGIEDLREVHRDTTIAVLNSRKRLQKYSDDNTTM